MTKKTVNELASSNLRYTGEKRLASYTRKEIEELAVLMSTRKSVPDLTLNTIDLIKYILERKCEKQAVASPSPLSPNRAAMRIQEKVRSKKVVDPSDAPNVLKSRHKLKIVAFNSLKLRVGRVGLEMQWLGLMKTLSAFDIILVSEVPAEERIDDPTKTRAYMLKTGLDLFYHESMDRDDSDAVEDAFQMVLSEPSGPGNPEVHVAFVRHPIRVVQFTTQKSADGTNLDHAPLTILVEDTRFKTQQRFLFTSVHFPPSARARARDSQIATFMKEYATNASFRLNCPLTAKGAKDARMARVGHVIAGDFNTYPTDEVHGLKSSGFSAPLIGESISTSAGGESYDNFLIDFDTEASFSTSTEVLELSIMQKGGVVGLSDHSPISLILTEQTTKGG